MSRTAFPSAEEGMILHQRLCAEDVTAPADVCDAYLEPLLAWLGSVASHVEAEARQSAVHDTVVDYVKHPRRYNPRCADLGVYLRMAARRDLYNLRRREERHQRRRISWEFVEEGEVPGNIQGREAEVLARLTEEEERVRQECCVRRVRASCTEKERAALDLLLAGVHCLHAYAEALGLAERPKEEQEREVKRVKDRLMKRLIREGRP
jgi:RNA polymerase sigma-70 factor (ECF subfamily)